MFQQSTPEIRNKLSLDLFLKYPHVLVTYVGDLKGHVDRILDEQGLKRHVAMSLPFYLAVPAIIASTDMIATISDRVARLLPWPGVRSFPIPLDYAGYNETMIWHRRNDGDPGHSWLRKIIDAESEKLTNGPET